MTLLHIIFQRQGITPDVFYAKPIWVQKFMIASTIRFLDEKNKNITTEGVNHVCHYN